MAIGAMGSRLRMRTAAVVPEPQSHAIQAVCASASEPPGQFQSRQDPLILNAGAKRPEIAIEQTLQPDTGGIKLTPSGPVAVTPFDCLVRIILGAVLQRHVSWPWEEGNNEKGQESE